MQGLWRCGLDPRLPPRQWRLDPAMNSQQNDQQGILQADVHLLHRGRGRLAAVRILPDEGDGTPVEPPSPPSSARVAGANEVRV